ncbi:flagellar biosynthesis protein FlgA [Cellulomonas sp. WB94]|nr:flagellar biosynthesis protein FlgA [Cellulomonas sp. WB94]
MLLWRARLPVTALLLGIACAVVVGELRPPPAQTSSVPVASHPLSAGHVLVASDLDLAEMPSGLVPSGAPTSAEPLVGASLAVEVPAGLPMVDGLLVHDLVTAPPGTVVAAVRLADPAVAALLATGTRVDVLAATDDGTTGRPLARGALVVASGDRAGRNADDSAPPLLLAVAPAEAAALAGAGPSALLSAVIVE